MYIHMHYVCMCSFAFLLESSTNSPEVITLNLQATATLLLVTQSLMIIQLLVWWRGPYISTAIVHSLFQHLIIWHLISLYVVM